MEHSKPIQIFEHKLLKIGEYGFSKLHWEALACYNEKHGGVFFTLIHNGVKFNQHVGVIQVGNLTIEILPKISQVADEENKAKWQRVLIDMLRECRWMQVYSQNKAALRFKPNSILEAYLELFINECQDIVRQGLVKKYRVVKSNCSALKGKLLFEKQIQINLIHKERFYTKHQVYDRENLLNKILLKALKLIPQLSQSPYLKDKVSNLVLSFPELEDINVQHETFATIIYDRKTLRYKEAIEIAAMLLLNFRPDISSGLNHILAILFDMNDLWEEYIFRQIYKCKHANWSVHPQNIKSFWKLNNNNTFKKIKPDIVIQNSISGKSIIIDTKWKLPENNIPTDADLKQMFVYNEYWSGENAILLYPNANYSEKPIYFDGTFAKRHISAPSHSCGIMRMAVLDSNNNALDNSIGKRINKFLKDEILL